MNQKEAKKILWAEWRNLCKKFPELNGVRFVWGRGIQKFGHCEYLKVWRRTNKEYRLANIGKMTVLITANQRSIDHAGIEKLKDTVRHEAAHALDVIERGYSDHDYIWKRWAVKTGAKPVACHSVKVPSKSGLAMYCRETGKVLKYIHRITPKVSTHIAIQEKAGRGIWACSCHGSKVLIK